MVNQMHLNDIPYSILDLSPIIKGGTPADSLKNTLDLARHAEEWGFNRYWLAEHHNSFGIASSATSVVIGYVASGTSTIRVGSGGIMLPNHAPLVIAEQFGTLESLFPGRIDLGLGRAPGTDQITANALRRDIYSNGQDFPELVQELRGYFAPPLPSENKPVRAIPGEGLNIPIWLLGSSGYSAQLSGLLGLPFAFASHFAPENTLQALEIYRRNFRPTEELNNPYAMVGVNIIAADSDEEAQWLATSLQQNILNLIRNNRVQLQPPVENIYELANDYEKAVLQQRLQTTFIGSPETIKPKLHTFLNKTNANEIIVNAQIYDHQARLHSYELVAEIVEARKR
ncbi:LLM class flavin-dependent oxidoreductase [Bacillus sp. EB600]|uniref:LLM class flavin-dependent oxidoreductase n=1 Tax=Bacillus sp. EB600 TaxID=2806345 RepID=UPI00210A3E00|nr:LLM class flavin-dependent oxidoreductase [Bacillus sp. EB600]MCQ6280559.1 LLM class flavin-dependent oxidoreductase [Bacillus sp. EB600]